MKLPKLLVAAVFNIHLNIDETMTTHSLSVFMSLKKPSSESLSKKSIEHDENTPPHNPTNFSLNFTMNRTLSLRVCLLFLMIKNFFEIFYSINDATICFC